MKFWVYLKLDGSYISDIKELIISTLMKKKLSS